MINAFDLVYHKALLFKLQRLGGGKFALGLLLQHFLTGRQQRIVVDGVFRVQRPILSGVTQVSILGPLLFLVELVGLVWKTR